MNWKEVMFKNSLSLIEFKKEILEYIRDKRLLLGLIVSTLLVTPFLMGIIFFFAGKRAFEKSQATLDIGIVEQQPFPELSNWLEDMRPSISAISQSRGASQAFEAEQFERRNHFRNAQSSTAIDQRN